MSLINDVLRDLDKRQARPETVSTGPLPPRPRRIRRHLIWPGIAILAGAGLVWILTGDHGLVNDPASPRSVQQASLSGSGPLPTVPVYPVGEASESGRKPVSPSPAEAPGNTLTRSMDATPHTTAGDTEKPGPHPEPLAVAGTPESSPGTETVTSEPAPDSAPVSQLINQSFNQPADLQPAHTDPVASPTMVGAGSPDPRDREAGTSGEEQIEIRRNQSVADAASEPDALIQARRAISRGQGQLAADLLTRHLRARPDDREATALLARLQRDQGQPGRAMDTLRRGLEQQPGASELAYLLARLLLEEGRTGMALDTLQAHAPDVAADADYHLLRAAALRQTRDHEGAEAAYRTIAETHPHRGAAWIGLGVSLESLGEPGQAIQAYEQATGADDAGAAAFARQRLMRMPHTDSHESRQP